MMLKRSDCCLTRAFTALSVGTMLAALALPGQTAQAQTCGATMQPTLSPPDTIFAVGQSLTINLTFGPTAASGGSMSISTVSVQLDCENASGCDIGNPCTDDSNVLSYDGDGTIVNGCPGTVITSSNPGGGTTNSVAFTFTPALVLPADTQCTFSFDVTILTLSSDNTPKVISGIGFFTGTCATGGLTGSACGTYQINVVSPDIEIVKTACPSLVCATGEDVLYTYVVTTGAGNAPISNVQVTDNECAPVTPTLQADAVHNVGDVNDNLLLDPGEEWEFTCSAFITEPTTNIATVTGEYVNNEGSVPVEDDDTMTVDVVQVNVTPGDCETTYTAKTGLCTGETCVWTGPGGFTSNVCQIVLGAANAPGEYCVTVTCPGGEEDCPHGCGQGKGSPPCQPLAATCCITFEPPSAPDCIINTGPTTVCVGDQQEYCETGPDDYVNYAWTVGPGTVCTIASGGGPTDTCVTVSFVGAGNCLIELTATDAIGCVAECELRVTAEDCGGGEGCTPGFWKQTQHFGHWPDQYCPTDSCCGEATLFCDVFDCAGAPDSCQAAVDAAFAGKTLLEVLGQGGGSWKALGRHAVAGLLNSKTIEYGIDDVIGLVNEAIADCDPGPAHQDLAEQNELGCPLSGQLPCADLNLDGGVNQHDLDILLGNWGHAGLGDINNDGIVGPADLSALLSNWGSF